MKSIGLVLLILLGIATCQIIIPLIRIPKTFIKVEKRGSGQVISIDGTTFPGGEFYGQVGIGTPPQYFYLQLDTGSADLLVFSQGCTSCGGSTSYQMSQSSSAVPVACTDSNYVCNYGCTTVGSTSACVFNDTYGDGSSVSGYVLTDALKFGTITASSASLGAVTRASAGFQNPPVDGIWGLAYPEVSSWYGDSALETLITAGSLADSFSMCLIDNNAVMSVGIDYSTSNQFQWADMPGTAWYEVTLNDIKLGSTSIGVSGSTYNYVATIIDSGTTLAYLPTSAIAALYNTFTGMCGSLNLVGICGQTFANSLLGGQCYEMTGPELQLYPPINFYFSGTTSPVALTYDYYLIPQVSQGNTYWCINFQDGGVDQITILGDYVMREFHVVFDRANQRVGFGAISTCPSTSSTTGVNLSSGQSTGQSTGKTTGKTTGQITGYSAGNTLTWNFTILFLIIIAFLM